MPRLNRITIVLAYWCPHCSPLSIEYISKVSEDLKTDCRILDIDNKEQEIIADEIVKKHGEDWEFNEGCLSIPEIREDIIRKEKIKIKYMNQNFAQI